MNNDFLLIFPVVFPILAGVAVFLCGRCRCQSRIRNILTAGFLLIEAVLIVIAVSGERTLFLGSIADGLEIVFKTDTVSGIFASLAACVWLLVGIYSAEYMENDGHAARFQGFFVMTEAFLTALAFSGNIITFYIFFESMTIISMPLVFHEMTHEAIMAGLKYLFYSVAGAFMALLGIILLSEYGILGTFTPGGILNTAEISANKGILYASSMLMIAGFGTKAGMMPMHGWLPKAHPEAPAPASAVLSGVITKMGILAVIRTVYYLIGPGLLRGTWVQGLWMILALVTVFAGSMMAFREDHLKKRLAYSTVSQVSYIMFGLSLMHPAAFAGAIAHVVYHSFIKNTLFMGAGAIIHKTGKTKASQLRGIGKEMPQVMLCFTFCSLGLIGIPAFSGFISKWYLITGSLKSGIPVFSWLGPVVLLVSALLTAGYLLPVSIRGFFPGADFNTESVVKREPSYKMLVPMAVMTVLTVIFGLFPGFFIDPVLNLAASLM